MICLLFLKGNPKEVKADIFVSLLVQTGKGYYKVPWQMTG